MVLAMALQVLSLMSDKDSIAGVGTVNYKDKRVPFMPQHTLGANADYRIDVDPAALLDPSNRSICAVSRWTRPLCTG